MKIKTVRPSLLPARPPTRRLQPVEAGCAALLMSLNAGCFGESFEYGNPSARTPTPPAPTTASSSTDQTGAQTASPPPFVPDGTNEVPTSTNPPANPSGSAVQAPSLPAPSTPPSPDSGPADAGASSAPSCSAHCGTDAAPNCQGTQCQDENATDEGSSCTGSSCEPQTIVCNASDVLCKELRRQLVHRYSFDGSGTTARDTVSGADGNVVETELDGTGRLKLDGGGAHVQLPSGIISALDSATFEMWVLWEGGDTNQRLFNFGKLPARGDAPNSYLSLSPSGSDGTLQMALRSGMAGSRSFATDIHFATGRTQHVALAVDADAGELLLYLDGELIVSETTPHELGSLRDAASMQRQEERHPGHEAERPVIDAWKSQKVEDARSEGEAVRYPDG